jgi:hypothetical protein
LFILVIISGEGKGKDTFDPVHVMKAYRESRGIGLAVLILNMGLVWWKAVTVTPRPLYPLATITILIY